MDKFKDGLRFDNHGVVVEFNHGANLGVGITKEDKILAYGQIEYEDVEQLKEFLERGSDELERRKELINAGAERNNELREYLKTLISTIQRVASLLEITPLN